MAFDNDYHYRVNLLDRLKAMSVETETGCWEWVRSRDTAGYGHLRVEGRLRKAHRVSYELLVGPIPEGLQLDHLCRNRACCNPDHLRPVTVFENIHAPGSVATGALHAAKTHCPQGHEYTPENIYRYENRRHCRTCTIARATAWNARKRSTRSLEQSPAP